LKLLEKYKPKYFIHGHVHRNYGIKIPRVCKREETTIVNAFEYYAFDY
jgi:Icc-related predicted phosphoesterase